MQTVKTDVFGQRRLDRMNIAPAGILNPPGATDIGSIRQLDVLPKQRFDSQFVGVG